ncbi:MAG: hypothetical protein OZ921_10460 [Sorangiineae bacterium]|nr:hypothetical protein [Sorangiineae bacterium]
MTEVGSARYRASRALGACVMTALALAPGCASPARPASRARPPEPPSRALEASVARPPALPPSEEPAASAAEPERRFDALIFERALEAPVHSLALGGKERVAALGDDAWLDRGAGFEKLPHPPELGDDVVIYFGRDALPRLMGHLSETRGAYGRFRGGAWERGLDEIGRLGSLPLQAFFGVLGDDDPEVVCRPGELCIVKRRTGWSTVAAPARLAEVELCGGVPWSYDKHRVAWLEKDGWHELGAESSFARASGLWALSGADVWVSERGSDSLHHYDGHGWTRSESPIRGPRGLWASAAGDLWLAGDGGAAHFDGREWSRVAGVEGALAVVRGRSAESVWLAGASGVWRGRARAAR